MKKSSRQQPPACCRFHLRRRQFCPLRKQNLRTSRLSCGALWLTRQSPYAHVLAIEPASCDRSRQPDGVLRRRPFCRERTDRGPAVPPARRTRRRRAASFGGRGRLCIRQHRRDREDRPRRLRSAATSTKVRRSPGTSPRVTPTRASHYANSSKPWMRFSLTSTAR